MDYKTRRKEPVLLAASLSCCLFSFAIGVRYELKLSSNKQPNEQPKVAGGLVSGCGTHGLDPSYGWDRAGWTREELKANGWTDEKLNATDSRLAH
jgi:hypothetical protein